MSDDGHRIVQEPDGAWARASSRPESSGLPGASSSGGAASSSGRLDRLDLMGSDGGPLVRAPSTSPQKPHEGAEPERFEPAEPAICGSAVTNRAPETADPTDPSARPHAERDPDTREVGSSGPPPFAPLRLAAGEWASVAEVAAALGLSPRAVRGYCEAGVVTGAERVGPRGWWRIPRAWVASAGDP